ncbi:MAG: DUF4446 family protein [Oscillospiraceae bacterium]|nr:DUF4446 family protein [Oscillospiraceae bacterium]
MLSDMDAAQALVMACAIMGPMIVALAAFLILTRVKLGRLSANHDRLMKFAGGDSNMEQVLLKCVEEIRRLSAGQANAEAAIKGIEANVERCVQRAALVRYSAFEYQGGDLSFTLALMDANLNGVVLTNLYSRDGSVCYAKPLINGQSKYKLADEEIEAIRRARMDSL